MIDLRSDTVTRPSAAMVAAMAAAQTGDDVYGEDPTVRALEEQVAGMLGHDAALFTVSGSMANGLGVSAHVKPGSEVLCEAQAHIVRAEMGAHAVNHGVTTRTWSNPRGLTDIQALRGLISPQSTHFVSTAAIEVENTHNFGGGVVQPLDDLKALRALADENSLKMHMDGARLWNAHVASGVPLNTYGQLADTVSVCLSKGLGAPIGSVLAGSADVVAYARQRRHQLGGGWRQAGVLAAAGRYALANNLERLADDHANAKLVAEILADARPGACDPDAVETNIVLVGVDDAETVVAGARDEGVLVGATGPTTVRVVTHLDVTREQVQESARVLARLVTRGR